MCLKRVLTPIIKISKVHADAFVNGKYGYIAVWPWNMLIKYKHFTLNRNYFGLESAVLSLIYKFILDALSWCISCYVSVLTLKGSSFWLVLHIGVKTINVFNWMMNTSFVLFCLAYSWWNFKVFQVKKGRLWLFVD